MSAPRQTPTAPSSTGRVFDAGGTDPDFYFPQRPARSGGFLRFIRSVPGRLVRSLRG
ncbi:hypothetical protein [Arthrobacter mobilis]|uniref:Uncharacterized protein n=1 Tax=Arthrobacter mobilis TaxID=2724944 RepID=A0A7X6QML0_9MICC|nr:hypothetical protein [Arthrobacter mobilis]NKX56733.1 hypothetical protein [Arthrobacter mobilis]